MFFRIGTPGEVIVFFARFRIDWRRWRGLSCASTFGHGWVWIRHVVTLKIPGDIFYSVDFHGYGWTRALLVAVHPTGVIVEDGVLCCPFGLPGLNGAFVVWEPDVRVRWCVGVSRLLDLILALAAMSFRGGTGGPTIMWIEQYVVLLLLSFILSKKQSLQHVG